MGWTQNPPGFGPWGFNSPSRHHDLSSQVCQGCSLWLLPSRHFLSWKLQRREFVVFLIFFFFQESSLQELPCQVPATHTKGNGKAEHQGPEGDREGDQDGPLCEAKLVEGHRYCKNNNDCPDQGC